MKTCEGNVGKVVAKQGKATIEWLEKNNVPYDELVFGKPYADIYIDDLAHRFEGWDDPDLEMRLGERIEGDNNSSRKRKALP